METSKRLLSIYAALAVIAPLASSNFNITSPKITDWGIWGGMQRCPWGRFAQGFQLKTEEDQGNLYDDTAMNALRLFCGDPFRPDTAVITSSQGQFGDWGQVYSCYPGMLTGFQLRSEPDQGRPADDTATNNIRFYCSNKNDYTQGDGESWGDWTAPQHCFTGQGICSIQTQIEPYQGGGVADDDSMLNNVRFECCDPSKTAPGPGDVDPNEKITTVKDLNIFPADSHPKILAVLKNAAEKN